MAAKLVFSAALALAVAIAFWEDLGWQHPLFAVCLSTAALYWVIFRGPAKGSVSGEAFVVGLAPLLFSILVLPTKSGGGFAVVKWYGDIFAGNAMVWIITVALMIVIVGWFGLVLCLFWRWLRT